MAVESRMTASSAGRSGDSARLRSRRSRSRISSTITCFSTRCCSAVSGAGSWRDSVWRAVVCSMGAAWRKRRLPRTSGAASRKIFTSASGKTAVPMSRPSITTPPLAPSARCCSTIHARTRGWTETRDAADVTSASRMRCETSMPSSRTRLPSSWGSSTMRVASASASSGPSSSNE